MTPDQVTDAAAALEANIELAIKGKSEVVRLAITCLLAQGHLLIEDVPGVGKTSLARALAASLAVSVQRIQFTPDLLPSDITGSTIWHQGTGELSFEPGPIFANVVLADEVNRASPKTQSALLEVMEEGRVTIDGKPREVPQPFMVVATQNPIEMDGTYPLPEAQLDRFLMRIKMDYPDHAAEAEILRTHANGSSVDGLRAVLDGDHIAAMVSVVQRVHVEAELIDHIVNLVDATRRAGGVRLGASPRASLALLRVSRAHALVNGRHYVLPEDIKALAPAVLRHRILLTPEAELQGRTSDSIVEQVLVAVDLTR